MSLSRRVKIMRTGKTVPRRLARPAGLFTILTAATVFTFGLTGCATAPDPVRDSAAKKLFETTARDYHFPSVLATGTEHDRLLREAAAGYERVLQQYPDQDDWCAKALRSLANVRATQGQLDAAVQLYARVAEKHPRQDWEILQAWKSAADLLWEAGRPGAAQKFYRQIVVRFDQPAAPSVVKLIVHTAKARLQ